MEVSTFSKHLSAVWTNLLSRNAVDKRARNEAARESNKRQKLENGDEKIPIYATRFSKEDIEAEGRKPKKKVAVMLGYAGSGYKGMQMYGLIIPWLASVRPLNADQI